MGKPTNSLVKFTRSDISKAAQKEHLNLNSQLEALSKRVEHQHDFYQRDCRSHQKNPLVIDVIEKGKLKSRGTGIVNNR